MTINNEQKPVDTTLAHRHFSADCFNRTWALLDLTNRSADEREKMILLAMSSLWHWTQRHDCTDHNRSIGHWLVSRVFAEVGQGENALQHAERSLMFAAKSPPFYIAYAHEALARAAKTLGDAVKCRVHLEHARSLVPQVADENERCALECDLKSLE